jgi:hypothetical protein
MRHKFAKGYTPWNKGKKCEYMSRVHKGKPSWNKGKRLSPLPEEHKLKISKSHIGINTWSKGKNHPKWKGGVSKDMEYMKKLRSDWKKNNKDRVNFHNAKRRALRLRAIGSHTLYDWENLKAQYDWTCPSCNKREPDIKLTVDHIIPLSRGGSHNIENIQPLCGICNSRKFTKVEKYEKNINHSRLRY